LAQAEGDSTDDTGSSAPRPAAHESQGPPASASDANSGGKQPLTPPQSLATGSVAPVSASPGARGNTSDGRPSDLTAALERHGDLTLRNSSIDGALFTIGELWHINIVVGEVKGTVNGVFKDAPLREILDTILLSNGYSYRPVGESLVVSPLAQLGQINPFFKSATIPVESADIDEIVEGAKLLSTPQGQVRAIKSARSIFVLDFPDRVQMIRDFVTSVDTATKAEHTGAGVRAYAPMEVGYFRTQYITAKEAQDALASVLSKEGRCSIMEKQDKLVVSDYAENLAMVETVLNRIDRPRPQVVIRALIYDLSLQDLQQLGINWNSGLTIGHGDHPETIGLGSMTNTGASGVAPGILAAGDPAGAVGSNALSFASTHFSITSIVEALNDAKDSRLLADPRVAVLENEDAVFKSVREEPVQQLTQTSNGGQIGTTAFREAGITLSVTPKIAADGIVQMVLKPEFSAVVDHINGNPVIDTRRAETVLNVVSGQTIAIGGLRQREDIGDFDGIPVLMNIPYAGALFRSRNVTVRESELVVFVSPEIITPAEPLDRREQMAVDTLGCRLNMIPLAEGCPPPPCVCGPPTAGMSEICGGGGGNFAAQPQPQSQSPVQLARLPEAGQVAAANPPSVVADSATVCDAKATSSSAPLPASIPIVPPMSAPQISLVEVSAPAPMQSMGPPPQRLPIVEQSHPATPSVTPIPVVAYRSTSLFDPPPRVDLHVPSDDDGRIRIGGAVQIGIRE
jgi:general secretion pathway protein D